LLCQTTPHDVMKMAGGPNEWVYCITIPGNKKETGNASHLLMDDMKGKESVIF
jgi:hypothetical protein